MPDLQPMEHYVGIRLGETRAHVVEFVDTLVELFAPPTDAPRISGPRAS